MNNPYDESDVDLVTPPGRYFKGNINEAVNELFRRSAEGASWYAQKCGGDVLTTKGPSDETHDVNGSNDNFSPPPETTTLSKRHLANWLSDVARDRLFDLAEPLHLCIS